MLIGSGTYPVTATADDALLYNANLELATTTHILGHFISSNSASVNRFQNVTIPVGAYIVSAKLVVMCNITDSKSVSVAVQFESAGNSLALSTYADFVARDLTTAVAWGLPASMTLNTSYDSPDISASLQEVIDNAAWASGNAITAVMTNSGSASDNYYQTYNKYTGNPVYLYVEWGAPPPDNEIATWNSEDAGSNITLDTTLLTATHA